MFLPRPLLALILLAPLCLDEAPARAGTSAPDTTAESVTVPLPTDTSATPGPVRWALVLSGGGARGFAHIGALRALEESGARPDLVVGTSMGALVGSLWASGYSSGEIAAMMRAIDWDAVFDPRRLAPEWRRAVVARPWVRLVAGGRGLGLPAGLVDDSELNFRTSVDLLDAEALAQGDFDRLPIPFRAVATDVADLKPVAIATGSIARGVRASISIPAVFPPVPSDSTLFVDGGVASNLPIALARRAGARRVLAIDVALADRTLREDESVIALTVALLDRINRRGQAGDTTRPGDGRVWIPLPHVSATRWAGVDDIIARGYRDSRDSIDAWVQASGTPRLARTAQHQPALLPPIAGPIAWFDRNGQPARRAREAAAVFGRVPEGRFFPSELAAGMGRIYRAGLFDSCWPWLRTGPDSTRIGMQVKDEPAVELRGAFAYDNDTEARGQASLVWRPLGARMPGDVTAAATIRKYGRELFASLGPHPLERGAEGWFVRGGVRETQVRLFQGGGLVRVARVDRAELTAGLQRVLPAGDIVQIGVGGAFERAAGKDDGGPLLAIRSENSGVTHRLLDAAWRAGGHPYGTLTLTVDRTLRLPREFGLRAALSGAGVTAEAPLDEWRGLGGPGSMSGLRGDEWLGRRSGGAELRLTRIVFSTFRAHLAGQVGYVDRAIGRRDLDGALHAGVSGGLAIPSALGPVALDYGIMDRSRFRVDLRIGQRF